MKKYIKKKRIVKLDRKRQKIEKKLEEDRGH